MNQSGAPCTYSLSKGGDSIGAAGGRLSFNVATLTGCNWSAASDAAWLTIAVVFLIRVGSVVYDIKTHALPDFQDDWKRAE